MKRAGRWRKSDCLKAGTAVTLAAGLALMGEVHAFDVFHSGQDMLGPAKPGIRVSKAMVPPSRPFVPPPKPGPEGLQPLVKPAGSRAAVLKPIWPLVKASRILVFKGEDKRQ
jgi:hypothetical protein